MGGYNYKINTDYTFMPSTIVKTDFTKMQFDLTAMMDYKNDVWLGIGMRGLSAKGRDAIIGNIGLRLSSQLKFGYSYDITTSTLSKYSSGTHEFMLTYRVGPPKPKPIEKIIRDPRFL